MTDQKAAGEQHQRHHRERDEIAGVLEQPAAEFPASVFVLFAQRLQEGQIGPGSLAANKGRAVDPDAVKYLCDCTPGFFHKVASNDLVIRLPGVDA